MNLLNKIKISLLCDKIGTDEFGNSYYEERAGAGKKGRVKYGLGRKRYVIYKGAPEASKVPAEWHRWLHYTCEESPSHINKYSWQKIHLPNLTGTVHAFLPKGKRDQRVKSSSDYQSWRSNLNNS